MPGEKEPNIRPKTILAGSTWSAPRVLDFGFGSSCEGSIISVPGRPGLLLFSHAGRIGTGHASINRWNLSVWSVTPLVHNP